jgi:hypothetical protein
MLRLKLLSHALLSHPIVLALVLFLHPVMSCCEVQLQLLTHIPSPQSLLVQIKKINI